MLIGSYFVIGLHVVDAYGMVGIKLLCIRHYVLLGGGDWFIINMVGFGVPQVYSCALFENPNIKLNYGF